MRWIQITVWNGGDLLWLVQSCKKLMTNHSWHWKVIKCKKWHAWNEGENKQTEYEIKQRSLVITGVSVRALHGPKCLGPAQVVVFSARPGLLQLERSWPGPARPGPARPSPFTLPLINIYIWIVSRSKMWVDCLISLPKYGVYWTRWNITITKYYVSYSPIASVVLSADDWCWWTTSTS